MGRAFGVIIAVCAALALYLFFWPVPVEPVAWDAPVDRGLVDPFDPNDRLRRARRIDISPHEGPEDIVGGQDGYLYAAVLDGRVIRFRPDGSDLGIFAETGGRPLGMEFDGAGNLIVANAYLGIQRITPDGEVELLVDSFNGEPIVYADDLAVADDGTIYFSDASSKFGAMTSGTLEGSRLDIIEHGGHGRIFRFDPETADIEVIIDGLNFANGVAISADQSYLVVSETGTYRLLKHWLNGPDAGRTDVLIDNLPGFPDNVNNGLHDRFWIGLVVKRNPNLDAMSGKPWLRKLVMRLPGWLQPQADPPSHVFAINGEGEVLMNLQDTTAGIPGLTGVYETADTLWLSSLFGNVVGRLNKQDLANP